MSQPAAPQSTPATPPPAPVAPVTVTPNDSATPVTGSVSYVSDFAPPPPQLSAADAAASFFFGGPPPAAPDPKPYAPITSGLALSEYDGGQLKQVQAPTPEAPPAPAVTPPPETPATPAAPATPAPSTPTTPETPAAPAPTATEDDPPAKKVGPMTQLAQAINKLVEKSEAPAAAPAAAPEKKDDPVLDPEIADREQALAYLAENDPRYKGRPLVEQDRAYRQQLQEYAKKWRAENPGKKFDADAEEHDAFHDEHAPDVPEKAIIKAEAVVAAKRLVEDERAQMRREQIRDRLEGSLDKVRASASTALVKLLDAESLDKLGERDPIAAAEVETAAEATGELLAEAARMFTPGAHYTANPASKAYIETLVDQQEAQLMRLPADQRQAGNLKFATCDQWLNMTPTQRQAHWSFLSDPSFAQQAILMAQASTIKAKSERAAKWVKPRQAAPAAPAAPTPTLAATPAATPAAAPRPTNPPTGGTGAPPEQGAPSAPSPERAFWDQKVWGMS